MWSSARATAAASGRLDIAVESPTRIAAKARSAPLGISPRPEWEYAVSRAHAGRAEWNAEE
nr:MAG: hypothetical protein DIU78_22320 [Pseudomonadota bacterium]